MSEELSKAYSPNEIEDKWYKIWEENGYFTAQPPNVTGILHMGHMLNNSIQDAILDLKE